MRVSFTKMQGAGNDFVVLDGTAAPLALSREQLQHLGDRRFGVGADQILLVERSSTPGVDFRYRIFNGASGDEVEHCGNGARCFVRFVRDQGLTDQSAVRVRTMGGIIVPRMAADGRVTVDMGAPVCEPERVPFDTTGLEGRPEGEDVLWPLALPDGERWISVVSMGNPHAVQGVEDVDSAPVATEGPQVALHVRFPLRVNAGFMQIVSRSRVRLRVFERGVGETLACGSGACAAVVAGIRRGLLDARVDVETRGGVLTIEWRGASVMMTGPAVAVFTGEIEIDAAEVEAPSALAAGAG